MYPAFLDDVEGAIRPSTEDDPPVRVPGDLYHLREVDVGARESEVDSEDGGEDLHRCLCLQDGHSRRPVFLQLLDEVRPKGHFRQPRAKGEGALAPSRAPATPVPCVVDTLLG